MSPVKPCDKESELWFSLLQFYMYSFTILPDYTDLSTFWQLQHHSTPHFHFQNHRPNTWPHSSFSLLVSRPMHHLAFNCVRVLPNCSSGTSEDDDEEMVSAASQCETHQIQVWHMRQMQILLFSLVTTLRSYFVENAYHNNQDAFFECTSSNP